MSVVALFALLSLAVGALAKAPDVSSAPSSATSDLADPDGDKGSQIDSEAAAAAREKAAWCHREYVSAKDCDEWVADQLAHRAARKADEERRREERRVDQEARRAERKADEERQGEGHHAHEAGAPRDTTGEATASSSSPSKSLMMLASLQGSSDQKAGAEEHKDGKLADPTVKSELCRNNYVSAKDCDEWVADQLARRVVRKADEERRWEQRHADEEARRAARKADEESLREERHVHEAEAPHDTHHEMVVDSGSAPEALMMLAVGADGPGDSQAADAARQKAEWCHRNYVSAKDCDKWVADQLARRAARKEDEARRHEDQRADDGARKAGSDVDATEMLPTLLFSADDGDDIVASDAWMQNLTVWQRHALRSKLAELARKSKKEQSIASQDGSAAVESMRQEYLGKTKHVIADYKKKAAAAAAAAAKAGESRTSESSSPQGKAAARAGSDNDATEMEASYGGDDSGRFPAPLAAACSGVLAFAITAHAAQLAWRGRHIRQGPALLTDAAPV